MKVHVMVVLAFVLTPTSTVVLHAQGGPITAPVYNETLVEITAARLAAVETWLNEDGADPAYDTALRKYNADVKAQRDWQACRQSVEEGLKPEAAQIEAQARREGPTADQAKDHEAKLKALAERLKAAKTPAEQQKIAQEMAAVVQGAMAQTSGTQSAVDALNAKAEQQIAAKCGAAPPAPGAMPTRKGGPDDGLPFLNTLDRLAAFCHRGPTGTGSDGSVEIGSIKPGAATDMRLYRFSKAEAAIIAPACPRISTLLVEKGGVNWNE